jgi:hypothetical protein
MAAVITKSGTAGASTPVALQYLELFATALQPASALAVPRLGLSLRSRSVADAKRGFLRLYGACSAVAAE